MLAQRLTFLSTSHYLNSRTSKEAKSQMSSLSPFQHYLNSKAAWQVSVDFLLSLYHHCTEKEISNHSQGR